MATGLESWAKAELAGKSRKVNRRMQKVKNEVVFITGFLRRLIGGDIGDGD